MADYGNCIEWVLRFEDRTLSGKTVNLGDGAGLTRFGVTSKNNPDLPADFYTCDRDAALETAKNVYWRKYWQPICGSQLPIDELAATLLSFAVNDGPGEAVKLLQGALGAGLTADGRMGAFTLAEIAKQNAADLAEKLREAQAAFYRQVVVRDPSKAKDLAGWLTRAQTVYPALPA